MSEQKSADWYEGKKEYPKWVENADGDKVVVESKEEHEALDKGKKTAPKK